MRMLSSLSLGLTLGLFLLPGCNKNDPKTGDLDNDGFTTEGGDCNDEDASIHPGAVDTPGDGTDQDCDGSDAALSDADKDGYCADPTEGADCLPEADCDDNDAAVHPGAEEIWYDGVDQNCDGNDGDQDGDGYAALDAGGDDCNDLSTAINPGVEESCATPDDDNCDGLTDSEGAAGCITWFMDADGDSYGTGEACTCNPPADSVLLGGDCADSDATIHPEADEICDGIDNDCDGGTDDADPEGAIDAGTWYIDADGDGHGVIDNIVLACVLPAGSSAIGDDCNDADASIYPGAYETPYDGIDLDCDGSDTDSGTDDEDSDGYVAASDCDDHNAAINPGANELCNGVDDNCDSLIDGSDAVDAPSWYLDNDGDTFGDPASAVSACTQPTNTIATGGDCNDADTSIYPGATEVLGDGVDQDCDGIDPINPDVDNDGYTAISAGGDDCDDSNAAIHPGATEICDANDADENCDGVSDDADPNVDLSSGQLWYQDNDGDGYGDIGMYRLGCDALSYETSDGSDCNDSSPTTHPGAIEVCDYADLDEDCNGFTDDRDAGVDPTTYLYWYADTDSDRYGDSGSFVLLCDPPSGYTADGTDCNDQRNDVHPHAPEYCDANNTDEDCDGLADDNDPDVITNSFQTWYTDNDADGYGTGAGMLACDGGPFAASQAGDCDDTNAQVSPGDLEVCDGANVDENCNGLADDNDPTVLTVTWNRFYADNDADSYGNPAVLTGSCDAPVGYTSDNTDCNDSNSSINPGAPEICDSRNTDENCDGAADDADGSAIGQSTWYRDADGDGAGTPSTTLSTCDQPIGYVSTNTDCNDSDNAINPAAQEICDAANVDEDCDGSSDDADSSVLAATRSTWYADSDRDGYGSTTSRLACDQPTNYVINNTDCNDAAASVHPGAQEICDAANVDEDCDNTSDDADTSVLASSRSTWYADSDNDGYGNSTLSQSSCDAPSGYIAQSQDCDDTNAAIHPGGQEVCDDLDADEDCDGLTDDSDPTLLSSSRLTWYSDGDGDNYGTSASSTTLACNRPAGYGAYNTDCADNDAGRNPGATEICQNGADENCIIDCLLQNPLDTTLADATYTGINNYGTATSRFGQSIGSHGDLNGDGIDDVIIGDSKFDSSSALQNIGRAYIFNGNGTGLSGSVASPSALISGDAAGDNLGASVMLLPDADNDGDDELLVGAYLDNGAATDIGWVGLFKGPLTSTTLLPSNANASVIGSTAGDYVGWQLALVGDQNNDGHSDWATSAYGWSSRRGRVGVYSGAISSTSAAFDSSTNYMALITHATLGDRFGASMLGMDVSGDGTQDLLVTAAVSGTVYIFRGPLTGAVASTTATYTLTGAVQTYATSTTYEPGVPLGLANAGDVDGDGYEDLLIGADSYDGTATDAGAAFLFLGPINSSGSVTTADALFNGTAANDYAGRSVAGAGDVNDDGFDDLLVGATGYDVTGGEGMGALIYGPVSGTYLINDNSIVQITGVNANQAVGATVAGIGDLNGDSHADFMLDAANGGTQRGEVSLFYGDSE